MRYGIKDTNKRSTGNVHDYGHKGEVHAAMTPQGGMARLMRRKMPRQAEQMSIEDPGDVT